MRKYDIETILERHKINLFRKYAEEESKQDPRMKIQINGVAYGGADFIKYVPNETDRTKESKQLGHYWSDVEIIYFDNNTSYGIDEFVRKRNALTKTGQHIRSVFRAFNWVECDIADFGTKHCSYTKKTA